MGNLPKRQHFLPKSYLEGFAKGEMLWVYDRGKNEYRRQPPVNTAVIKNFYVFENTKGENDYSLETYFSKIEGQAKRTIVDLENGIEITPEARLNLAHFIALMMVRSPKFDREMNEIADAAAKETIKHSVPTVEAAEALAKQHGSKTGGAEISGESLFKFIHNEEFKVEPGRNNVIIAMLGLAERVTFEVAMMDWAIVHAPASTSFITTDEPIGYIVPEELRKSGEPILGLGSQKIVKVVSLSQSVAILLGKFGGGFGHLQFSREEVREVNLLIASECDRYVIGRDEALVKNIVKYSGVDKGSPGTRLKLEHILHPSDPKRSFLVTRRVTSDEKDQPFQMPEGITSGKKFPQQFSLQDNQSVVLDFEKLLRQNTMQVPSGSPLEDASLAIMEMVEIRKDKTIHNKNVDCRDRWRQALFLADISRKAIRAQSHPDFKNLLFHLRLLLQPHNFSQFSAISTSASPIAKESNNKVFELFVATILFQICSNLHFDEPGKSKGSNPDAIGEFNGKRWGFACKVSHSENPLTFLERVREGVNQIEKADVEHGLVIVSLKNLVPHDITWPAKFDEKTGNWLYGAFPMSDDASMIIQSTFEKFQQMVVLATNGSEGFENIFVGKKAIPVILMFYCTVTSVSPKYGVTVPTIVKRMMAFGVSLNKITPEGREVLELINDYLHDKLE